MFHCIKSFSKIQFQNDRLVWCLFALVNVLISPSNTILNHPRLQEAILIDVHKLKNFLVRSVGEDFSEKFKANVQ
jgi:hypothetical protein